MGGLQIGVPSPHNDVRLEEGMAVYDEVTFVVDWATADEEEFESSLLA